MGKAIFFFAVSRKDRADNRQQRKDTGVKMTNKEKNNTIVSEVEVDRQQWKCMGASAGSNAEPISCLEVAEGKN